MKNSLVSKLKKLALVPAFALGLNAISCGTLPVRDPEIFRTYDNEVSFRVEGNLGMSAGYADYGKYEEEKLVPYENWGENFVPSNSDMSLHEGPGPGGNGVINVGISPKLKFGKFAFGPTAMLNFAAEHVLREIKLHWWDPVTVKSREYCKSPLSLGISADYYFNNDSLLNATFSMHKFSIAESDYKGVDVWGGQNYSYISDQKLIDEFFGWKIASTFYFRPEDSLSYYGIGAYFEKNGEDVWGAGIVLDWKIGIGQSF